MGEEAGDRTSRAFAPRVAACERGAPGGDDYQRIWINPNDTQILLAVNFIWSIYKGRKCESRNPWEANTLEWTTPTPPGHGNFDFQPVIYRGPYEYASPEVDDDYYPQTQPPTGREVASPKH